MVSCSVKNCKNRSENVRGKNVKFHSFPKEKNIALKWVKACGRSIANLGTARICSHHFLATSYKPKPEHYGSYSPKHLRTLFPNAEPTEHLISQINVTSDTRILKEVNQDKKCTSFVKDVSTQNNTINYEKCSNENIPVASNFISFNEYDQEHNYCRATGNNINISNIMTAYNVERVKDVGSYCLFSNSIQEHIKDELNKLSEHLQLVVLLDKNYGVYNQNRTPSKKNEEVNVVESTKITKPMNATPDTKNSVMTTLKTETNTAVNGADFPLHLNQERNLNLGPSTNNLSNTSILRIASNNNSVKTYSARDKRCRSCLKICSVANMRKITDPCFMDKTVNDAITQLIPELNIPLQVTDAICSRCFQILHDTLKFASMFKHCEKVLEAELKDQKLKESLTPKCSSVISCPAKYPDFKDNITLDIADKIISLSKIDNNNLTQFIETLKTHKVNVFQHEANPFARKRVLLLGHPKLHRCDICFGKFLSENQLEEHLTLAHQVSKEYLLKPIKPVTGLDEETLSCRACNKCFPTELTLKSHLVGCVSFPCPYCKDNQMFSCDELVEHTRTQHEDKTPFKCCKCKNEFSDYRKYIRHSCAKHGCGTCGKKFSSTSALSYHKEKHKNAACSDSSKTCSVCNEIVKSNDYLSHLKTHKNFTCTKCGMEFYKSETFEEHEQTHKDLEKYKCDTCNELFHNVESLQIHQEGHDSQENKGEMCEICNEMFDCMRSLKQHITYSHGDPNEICELCGKELNPEQMKQHIEIQHTDKLNHQCPLCSQSFGELILYKRHVEEHTNGMKHFENIKSKSESNGCKQDHELEVQSEQLGNESNFGQDSEVQHQELREVVSDPESIEAVDNIDGNIVNDDDNVAVSTKRIHPEKNISKVEKPNKKRKMFHFNTTNAPLICKYCLKSFNSLPSLTMHVQSHLQLRKTEKCSQCDFSFLSRAARIKHERSHKNPTYKFRCIVCWRIMQSQAELNEHMQSHSNILTCNVCGEKFARQWQLDAHFSSHHAPSVV